jgi:hypothetical protein
MRATALFMLALSLLPAALPAEVPVFGAGRVLPSGGDRPIPLAPGLLISIYGSHLGPLAGCQGYADSQHRETPSPLRPKQMFQETLIYPPILCDTQVFVGTLPAGLLYVQEGQINFKVPQETPITGTAELRVVYRGQGSLPVSLPLGLESTTLSLETPAAVGMPVWLKVSAFGWDQSIQYPFDIRPANFKCTEVEVRRNGVQLPRIASPDTQIRGGIAMNGPICGVLGLPTESHHLGRIPLHLQYRFDRPGTYEVRYTLRNEWRTEDPADLQSAWTPIEILPGKPQERARWLADMDAHAPSGTADLLTDFLPSILGVPDEPSLRLLCRYLYHPDSLVRQFAMYGLGYWPEAQAEGAIMNLMRARGPSDVIMNFLAWSKLTTVQADSIVESAISHLTSSDPVMLLGAVTALDRLALSQNSLVSAVVRTRVEHALIDAAGHIVSVADVEIVNRYAMALGMVKDDRAGAVLWDLVNRDPGEGQALIALTWRKAPADLPKLAQFALRHVPGNNRDEGVSSLPYVMHQAYGDDALPYLERILERSDSTRMRTAAALQLMISSRPAGFAFTLDALENNRPYRAEMLQLVRAQLPDLREADDAAVLRFLQAHAKK